MKARSTSTKLVVSVGVLLLVGASVVAVTERVSPTVTRVPVCIKDNGQVRVATDRNNSCGPSERQMDCVVGGEVTDRTSGSARDWSVTAITASLAPTHDSGS